MPTGSTPTSSSRTDRAATLIRDRVRYAIPYGPLGRLAHRLFVRRDLERIFDYRATAFARLVEGR